MKFELLNGYNYNSTIPRSLYLLQNTKEILYPSGCVLVSADVDAPNVQRFNLAHDDSVTTIDVSSKGHFIATGQKGKNSDVYVWDASTKKTLYKLSEHDSAISCVRFSRDEKLLCTTGDKMDRRLIVWDMLTGYIVARASALPIPTQCIAWADKEVDVKNRPTDRYLVACAGNREIYLWTLNVKTGEFVGEKLPTGQIDRDYTSLEFSMDGSLLFAGTMSGDVVIIHSRARKVLSCVCAGSAGVLALSCFGADSVPGGVRAAAVTSSSDLVGFYTGSGDGTVKCFTVDGNNAKQVLFTKITKYGGVVSLQQVDRGTLLIGTSKGEGLFLKTSEMSSQPDVTSPKIRGPPPGVNVLFEHFGTAVTDVSFSDDDPNAMSTTSMDGLVKVWNLKEDRVKSVKSNNDGGESPLSTCFLGNAVISGWQDGSIKCTDDATGSMLWSVPQGNAGGVTCLQPAHNKKFFVSGGVDGHIRVWEGSYRELVGTCRGHKVPIVGMKLLRNDQHLLSWGLERPYFLFDLRTESIVISRRPRVGNVYCADIHRDGTTIVTVGQDKTLTLWDVRKDDPIQSFDAPGGLELMSVAISHTGTYMATGSVDGTVRFHDWKTLKVITACLAHSKPVKKLVWSPDDLVCASVGDDGMYHWCALDK